MNCSKFKNKQLLNKNNLICISRKWVSNVVKYLVGMRYLFIWFCLEFVDFLQFWNFECSMSITAFSLQIVDLSITLLDLHLHVPFLLEHGTALLIKFHAQSRQVIFIHGWDIRKSSNFVTDWVRNDHDDAFVTRHYKQLQYNDTDCQKTIIAVSKPASPRRSATECQLHPEFSPNPAITDSDCRMSNNFSRN